MGSDFFFFLSSNSGLMEPWHKNYYIYNVHYSYNNAVVIAKSLFCRRYFSMNQNSFIFIFIFIQIKLPSLADPRMRNLS